MIRLGSWAIVILTLVLTRVTTPTSHVKLRVWSPPRSAALIGGVVLLVLLLRSRGSVRRVGTADVTDASPRKWLLPFAVYFGIGVGLARIQQLAGVQWIQAEVLHIIGAAIGVLFGAGGPRVRRFLAVAGGGRIDWRNDVLTACGVLPAVLVASAGINWASNAGMGVLSVAGLAPWIVWSCLVHPVVEEFYFRGVLYGALGQKGALAQVVGTSIIFALSHPTVERLPAIFVASVALTWARSVRGSVYAAMIAHGLINGVAVAEVLRAAP